MINIAILGFGTVGSGVCELIMSNSHIISKKINNDINIKYICDIRDFSSHPLKDKFVKDFNIVLEDNDVSLVVETMGGSGIACKFTEAALRKGKNVVTSNKEAVATHGHEFMRIAKEHNVKYMFEASVGGGIPVLTPIVQCLAANNITAIAGILNGTTNYILTQMFGFGKDFDTALREAQENGYAEKDPSADILGKDTCRKICILAAIMTGKLISPDSVKTLGITEISNDDVLAAENLGGTIKLIGISKKIDNKIFAEVAPYFIENTNPLYCVNDVFNAVLVNGDATDEIMFYGKGAGKMPTASAVVADIIDIAMHSNDINAFSEWTSMDESEFLTENPQNESYILNFILPDINMTAAVCKVFGIDNFVTEGNTISFISDELSTFELNNKIHTLTSAGISVISKYKVLKLN